MANFCGKCGSRLDVKNGLCPNCNAGQIYRLKQIEKKKRTTKRIISFTLAGVLLATIVVSGFGRGNRFGSKVKNAEDAIAQAKKLSEEYGYENAMSELTEKNEASIDGDHYYRLQQNYQGIPVYGRTVIYAADEHDAVTSVTGNALDVDENIDLTPEVTADQVKDAIRSYLADEYGIDNPEDIKVADVNENNLCIYNMGETGESRLAYCVNAYGYEFVVDAHSAEVLFANSLTNSVDVKGNLTGQTVHKHKNEYSDEQYLQDGEEFYLIDQARNIETYQAINCKQWEWSVLGTIEMLKDAEFVKWTRGEQPDASAVDAYHNVKIAYDYFDQVLNNKGADGFGKVGVDLVTGVEWFKQSIDGKEKNMPISGKHAFSRTVPDPNGDLTTILYFEAGNNKNLSCAAYLDTVAHEYAHSVEKLHSGMIGNGEPSAIMEALSDIFGELVEAWWKEEDPNWQNAYRNHQNPNSRNCASKVNDEFWVNPSDLSNDDGGEHVNSTVISHAAYLMWNGIDGDESKKISNDDLAKLWYRAMLMMPSDCNFMECRKLVELAASSLYLEDNPKTKCVSEAFDKVGILKERYTYVDYELKPGCKLGVMGYDGKPYDKYTITVLGGTDLSGPDIATTLFPFNEFQGVYEKTTVVTSTEPFALPSLNGDYTVTITDNADETQFVAFTVRLDAENSKDYLPIYGTFGQTIVVPLDPTTEELSFAEEYYKKLVSSKGLADDHIETKMETTEDQGASTICLAPEQGKLGIIFKDVVDFDQNGIEDLIVVSLEEFEGKVDKYEGAIQLTQKVYLFDEEGKYFETGYSNITPIQGNCNYYFYTAGKYMVNIIEEDISGDWIDGLRYEVIAGNETMHNDHIHISGYDMDEPDNGNLPGEILYVGKDFRKDGEKGSVCYTIDDVDAYYTIYNRGFTLSSSEDRCLSTETEGCEYINNLLGEMLEQNVGEMAPVSWDERWGTSFFPKNNPPKTYTVLKVSATPSHKTGEQTTSSDIVIEAEYKDSRLEN